MIPTFTPLEYIKAGIAALALALAAFIGWYFPHSALVDYKAQIKNEAEKQIASNISKEKQHTLIVQGIKNEYQARLSLLDRTYPIGVREPSASALLSGQGTTGGITPAPTYDVLINQCAKTTLMLVSLQEYEHKRLGINHDEK